ncbi:MAG: SET domain-containing protein-lysine N-methyltransferase [Proteobacteria bacterium]|nr:MAG: SET domain-containing protein-lysine N-methyltransferase [Pseudomonadota bacterium]
MKNEPYQSARGVDIKVVTGKGRGVIATRKFRAGEIIETAPALVVPKPDLDVLAKTFLGSYLFTTDNKKNVVVGLGITSMLNHGEDANAEFFVTIDQITIKAKKAIVSGSEITLDYRWGDKEWMQIHKSNEVT